MDDRPNIVLITLDCMRHDRLAVYGGDSAIAPRLNELAAKGTVFINAHTAIGTTFPSHATMLTGLYPRMHGVRSNEHRLAEPFVTVPELLRDAGYLTGAFVSFRQMVVMGGLGQGFDAVSDSDASRIPDTDEVLFGEEGLFRDGADTTRMAIDWIRSSAADDPLSPIMLWVHYFEPHTPYRLNDWSRERLSEYTGPLKGGAGVDFLRTGGKELIKRSREDRLALETLYDGEVHKMDAHVGELVDALEENGRLDNAVLIVASDHGQGLGRHGRTGHGPTLEEEVTRIPMFIVDMRRPSSRVVRENVGTVDIGPTMLELAGIEHSADWQGRSLVRALEGRDLEPGFYFSEVEFKDSDAAWYHPDKIAVYDSGFKLEYRDGNVKLFNLEADPLANRRLQATRYPTRVDYLRGLAEDFLSRETDPVRSEMTEKDLETLRSLGYIQ